MSDQSGDGDDRLGSRLEVDDERFCKRCGMELPDECFDYDRREVAVWNTLGRCNDYLSVVDKKPGESDAGPRWFK